MPDKKDHYLKKELYQLIREDDSILEFVQDNSIDGLWYWDLENPDALWMSEKFWNALGFEPKEMSHTSDVREKLIFEEDIQSVLENLHKSLENPEHSYDHIVRYKHKSGRLVWIHCKAITIRDEKEKATRILGGHRDISALKEKEEELMQQTELSMDFETKYNALYTYSPLCYQSLDTDGCFIDVNPRWLETLGYLKEEVIGKWFGDFLAPDYVEHFRINFPEFKKRGFISGIQFKMKKKTGEFIFVSFEGCVGYTPQGAFKQTYCVFRDITESRRLNDSLKMRESLLNNVLSSVPDLVSIHDTDFNIVYSNWNGFGNIPQYRRKLNTKCYHTYRGFNEICPDCQAKQVLKTKQPYHSDYQLPDGVWIDLRVFPVFDEKGEITNFVEWVREITQLKESENRLKEKNEKYEILNEELSQLNEELRQLNEELIESKAKAEEGNRLKTEFLHNLSHEIRTPMNGIIGFTNMLRKADLSDDKRDRFSEIIEKSSFQLLKIIDDILEISRLNTEKVDLDLDNICLKEFLKEKFEDLKLRALEKNIPAYLEIEEKDLFCKIQVDHSKLDRILNSLIENALKYTYEGFIELGCVRKNDAISIYVKDTGIGIDPKYHETIFERFCKVEDQRNVNGLGLGLSIARENARLLGGDIRMESKLKRGSSFYLTFPCSLSTGVIDEAIDVFAEKEELLKSLNNPLMLIAEDEQVNYLYLETIIAEMDGPKWTILHAKNGEEAIDIFKEHENIKMILMDVKMPFMDGNEAAREIKKINPDVPIIIQTAYTSGEEERKCLGEFCNGYISKPIDKDSLQKLILKNL